MANAFSPAIFAPHVFAQGAFGNGPGPGVQPIAPSGGSNIGSRIYYPTIEPEEDLEPIIEMIRRQEEELEEMIIMLITKGFI